MLRVLDSRQITEWMAFYQVEGFGEEAAQYRTGIVASVIANVFRRKGRRAYSPIDFMPKPKLPPKPQTQEEMRVSLEAWVAAMEKSGKVKVVRRRRGEDA